MSETMTFWLYISIITLILAGFFTYCTSLLTPIGENPKNRLHTFIFAFACFFGIHALEISQGVMKNIDFLYILLYVLLALWLKGKAGCSNWTAIIQIAIFLLVDFVMEGLAFVLLSKLLPKGMYLSSIQGMFLPVLILAGFSTLILFFARPLFKKMKIQLDRLSGKQSLFFAIPTFLWILLTIFSKFAQYNALEAELVLYGHLAVYLLLAGTFVMLLVKQMRDLIQLEDQLGEPEHVQLSRDLFETYFANIHDINNLIQGLSDPSADGPETAPERMPKNLSAQAFIAETTQNEWEIFQRLLTKKIWSAVDKGLHIDFNWDSEFFLNEKHASPEKIADLTLILGILLDNSLDHLLSHPEINNHITVRLFERDHMILIGNHVSPSAETYLNKVFDVGVTSKIGKVSSGFGVSNAQKLAEKNGLSLTCDYDKPFQFVQFTLKKL